MMKKVSPRTLLPLAVFSLLALVLCHLPSVQAQPRGDVYGRYANIMYAMNGQQVQPNKEETKPSPQPMTQEFAEVAQTEVVDRRNITLAEFGDGFAVEGTFTAPNAGRVSMNLMDELGENIILHVDAQYWYYSERALVLNALHRDSGWGPEKRSYRFDFNR